MQTENYVTIRTYHDHIMGEIMIAALSNAGIKTFRFDEINNVIPNIFFIPVFFFSMPHNGLRLKKVGDFEVQTLF